MHITPTETSGLDVQTIDPAIVPITTGSLERNTKDVCFMLVYKVDPADLTLFTFVSSI
jgi:hypothetical protein